MAVSTDQTKRRKPKDSLFWGFSQLTVFPPKLNAQSPQAAHIPSHLNSVLSHVSAGAFEESWKSKHGYLLGLSKYGSYFRNTISRVKKSNSRMEIVRNDHYNLFYDIYVQTILLKIILLVLPYFSWNRTQLTSNATNPQLWLREYRLPPITSFPSIDT